MEVGLGLFHGGALLGAHLQLPGWPSLFFLAWTLFILPWLAIRSARKLKFLLQNKEDELTKEVIWVNTVINQFILLALSLAVGATFDYQPFAGLTSIDGMDLLAALGALAFCLLVGQISKAIRSDEERRKMIVYKLTPRTKLEWVLWTFTVALASVTEEIAYRGVAMSILWYSLGNFWASVLICSIAFAVAHSVQGWKSALLIFVFALAMHALVAVTQTLLLAMAVHAIYDTAARYRISREARQRERLETS